MSAPIIVTALLGDADFAWLDGLRRRHFPPERNVLPAHLTLFHHLPPSIAPELGQRLAAIAAEPEPPARAVDWISLGGGVALRVESPALGGVRDALADAFTGLLTPQDQARWRPHVTVQNKVPPEAAARLRDELSNGFNPRPIRVVGLASWYYRGGPWEPIGRYRFRGVSRSGRSLRS